jgi:catechol 2,3-dioxygenase-like lactoylglutathione lyase family enzyme
MRPHLHHTGIVVPSEEEVADLMALMGLEEAYRGYVSQWHALCIFTMPAGGSPIEFVVADGGELKKFNRGVGGIHHVALSVDSLDEVVRQLDSKGMRLLESQHVKGAGNFLCNFLSPIYTRGIPVEFVQELPGPAAPE